MAPNSNNIGTIVYIQRASQIDGRKYFRANESCKPLQGQSFIEPRGLALQERIQGTASDKEKKCITSGISTEATSKTGRRENNDINTTIPQTKIKKNNSPSRNEY